MKLALGYLRAYFFLSFIFFFLSGQSQTAKPLTIGDTIPGIEITNIINYTSSTASLSDFKGKLILIDFWGTTCTSCIAALPFIDSLQRRFKNDMQVFTVTSFDTEEKVRKTLERLPKLRHLKLPIVLGDRLKTYFPHEIVSHVVWIDGEGIVRAITGTEYVNVGNIKKILAGSVMDWPVKNDLVGFDYNRPFLEINKNNAVSIKSGMMYYSAMTGYLDGVDSRNGILIDSSKNTFTDNYFNLTLLQLAGMMIRDLSGNPGVIPKRIIFKVKDENRYIQKNEYYAEWNINNTYCYSISLPLHIDNKRRLNIIKDDLRRWFDILGIDVRIEKRKVKCLKLVKANNKPRNNNIESLPRDSTYLEKTGYRFLTKVNTKNISEFLNYEVPGLPWIYDATGNSPSYTMSMIFKTDTLQNLSSLRTELERYGLDAVEDEQEMEMYIIEER